MRRYILSALMMTAAVTMAASGAQAADLFSQDSKARVLTVTTKAGKKNVEVAAKGEVRDICDGCTIATEDGQMVEPKASDFIFLTDGKLSIYED